MMNISPSTLQCWKLRPTNNRVCGILLEFGVTSSQQTDFYDDHLPCNSCPYWLDKSTRKKHMKDGPWPTNKKSFLLRHNNRALLLRKKYSAQFASSNCGKKMDRHKINTFFSGYSVNRAGGRYETWFVLDTVHIYLYLNKLKMALCHLTKSSVLSHCGRIIICIFINYGDVLIKLPISR